MTSAGDALQVTADLVEEQRLDDAFHFVRDTLLADGGGRTMRMCAAAVERARTGDIVRYVAKRENADYVARMLLMAAEERGVRAERVTRDGAAVVLVGTGQVRVARPHERGYGEDLVLFDTDKLRLLDTLIRDTAPRTLASLHHSICDACNIEPKRLTVSRGAFGLDVRLVAGRDLGEHCAVKTWCYENMPMGVPCDVYLVSADTADWAPSGSDDAGTVRLSSDITADISGTSRG